MGVGRGPGYTLPEGLQPSRRNLSQVIVNSAQINASCNLSQPLTCTEGLEQIALQLGLPRPSTSNVRLGGCLMPKQLLCLSVMYHNLTPENLQRVGRIQHAQVSASRLRLIAACRQRPDLSLFSLPQVAFTILALFPCTTSLCRVLKPTTGDMLPSHACRSRAQLHWIEHIGLYLSAGEPAHSAHIRQKTFHHNLE